MLPSDAVRTITIYCRWTDPITSQVKPFRRVLKGCGWEERSISAALKTGDVLKNSAVIRVFDDTSGLQWIPAREWSALSQDELDGLWTCDLELPANPLIIPHEIDAEMDFGSSMQAAVWENDIIRNIAGATRVVECNDNRKRYGSHIRIRAGG